MNWDWCCMPICLPSNNLYFNNWAILVICNPIKQNTHSCKYEQNLLFTVLIWKCSVWDAHSVVDVTAVVVGAFCCCFLVGWFYYMNPNLKKKNSVLASEETKEKIFTNDNTLEYICCISGFVIQLTEADMFLRMNDRQGTSYHYWLSQVYSTPEEPHSSQWLFIFYLSNNMTLSFSF